MTDGGCTKEDSGIYFCEQMQHVGFHHKPETPAEDFAGTARRVVWMRLRRLMGL